MFEVSGGRSRSPPEFAPIASQRKFGLRFAITLSGARQRQSLPSNRYGRYRAITVDADPRRNGPHDRLPALRAG
jgi:hypothetical protein